jgi:fused signal recognition particle receptor
MAWFDRLTTGLKRSRCGFMDSLARVLRGRRAISAAELDEIEEVLISADVGVQTAASLVAELTERARLGGIADDDLLGIFKSLVLARLDGCERSLTVRTDGDPTVLLFAGVNGVGKTTTIAKIAARLREERPDHPITFAAADTFRAAAAEQLRVWADRVGADLIRQTSGADPAAVVYDALDHVSRTGGVLFVDTAGRLQTKHNLMEELHKIERTVVKKLGRGSDERLLVLDATTGQNGISQAQRFHDTIRLTGLVLTKLDSTAKGGMVLAIYELLKLPLLFIGVGEATDDLHAFSASEFVEALFAA